MATEPGLHHASEGSKDSSRWREVPRIIAALPTGALIAFVVCMILIGVALFAPLLAPHGPVSHALPDRMLPPRWSEGGSPVYPLGTDNFGRCVLSRLIYGTRISLAVAATAIMFGGVLGGLVGIASGYFGGIADALFMRVADIFLAIPTILIAIALAVALGPSFRNLVFVISLFLWPKIARQIRGETLLIKKQEYMQYGAAIGVAGWRLMLRHILPNVSPTLFVLSTLEIGQVILLEATLGFLGAGVPPPAPSWGAMVAEGRGLVATGWWLSVFPGIAIALTVLTFNSLGDSLRDYLDPRLKQR